MSFGWDYPPGVSASDIPGYNDVERTVVFECDNSEEHEEDYQFEEECTVDGRLHHESYVEAECPKCGTLVSTYYKEEE